jgi:hypothetical protein
MKAYKIELLIIDFDQLGPNEIQLVLEQTKYPNWCIYPNVMKIEERELGEWTDEHPLNGAQQDAEYQRLFGVQK